MISIDVRVDVAQMRRQLTDIQRRQIPKAAAYAINRSLDTGRGTAAREISSATKIKQKDVRKRLYIRRANALKLIGEVEAFPFSPNLAYFRARENKLGVAASAWEKRKTYKGAFITPKGKVVTRIGDASDAPLKGLRGPSVPRTFMQERILAKIVAAMRLRWRTDFERDLARRLASKISSGPS
jgi:hypothetical protein